MKDKLFLADSLTIRTQRVGSGLTTVVESGGKSLITTRELLDAALGIAGGTELSEAQIETLREARILQPTNPFGDRIPDVLTFRQSVSVCLDLVAPTATLQGMYPRQLRPTQTLYESIDIPAFRLGPILNFYETLFAIWEQLSCAPDAGALLGQYAQKLWQKDLGLQAVLDDIGAPGAPLFSPLVPLHESSPQCLLNGVRLGKQNGESVLVPIKHWDDLPEVLCLLRTLAKGAHGDELKAVIHPERVVAVKEWIAEDLLFEPPNATLQLHPGHVAHLGHGTLLGNLAGKTFMVDPWLPACPPGPGLMPLPRFAVPPIDALLFTKFTPDLANLETLLLLPEDTPIYVCSLKEKQFLCRLGFLDIHLLQPGECASVGDLYLQSIPSETPGAIGWHIHDGEHGCMALGRHTIPQSANARHQISPVFTSRGLSFAPRFTLGWPVLLEPSQDWLKPVRKSNGIEQVAEGIKPDVIAVYCEGGGRWYRQSSAIQGLKPTADELSRKIGCLVHVSAPYDVYSIGGGFKRSIADMFTRR